MNKQVHPAVTFTLIFLVLFFGFVDNKYPESWVFSEWANKNWINAGIYGALAVMIPFFLFMVVYYHSVEISRFFKKKSSR